MKWAVIENIVKVLGIIKRFTENVQSDKAFISSIVPLIKWVYTKLDKISETYKDVTIILDFIKRLKNGIIFRFTAHLMDYELNIAAFLDPRYKDKGPADILLKEYKILKEKQPDLFLSDGFAVFSNKQCLRKS